MRIALLALLFAGAAAAQPRLEVLETDPPPGTQLRPGDSYYARVFYSASEDLRVFGRPKGAEHAHGASHASPLYPAGAGEALVWFTLRAPARIELMRLEALPAKGGANVIEVPVGVEWAAGAPPRPRPAWAEALNREQQALLSRPMPARAGDAGADLLVVLAFASVPLYLLAQGFAFWRLRGRRRLAVWLPALFMAAVYAVAVLGGLAGSNLAPIWVVFLSPVALLYVLGLLAVDISCKRT